MAVVNLRRPLKYADKAKLEADIEAYFEKMDEEGRPYTISGLAVALDTSRNTLIQYEEKDEYVNTIKKAKQRCENWAEEAALMGKANSTFSIFSMKNNYGWVDEQKRNVTSESNVTISSEEQDMLKKAIKNITSTDETQDA